MDESNLSLDINSEIQENEFKMMREIKTKFMNYEIPLFIKNALIEVYNVERKSNLS
jgi:hypothetical protein